MLNQVWENFPAVKIHKVAFFLAKKAEKQLQVVFGLTLPQFMVMATIEAKKQCKQNEVAHMRFLSEAAISKMIDGLVTKGFVNRKENPENRREHVLTLTSAGEELFKKSENVVKNSLGEIFNSLTSEEQMKLDQILSKILGFNNPDNNLA